MESRVPGIGGPTVPRPDAEHVVDPAIRIVDVDLYTFSAVDTGGAQTSTNRGMSVCVVPGCGKWPDDLVHASGRWPSK